MNGNTAVPVGFRFHPTDEELVGCYLLAKVRRTQDEQFIKEIDLYKIEPWDLHDVCRIGDDAPDTQTDLYFFSHKDKKYPTGNRANRATAAGFWKATGRDKPIHERRQLIGMRKTLVFYQGRAPNGQKTDWIMHEFRVDEGPGLVPNYEADGWVVCRVFRKTKNFKMFKSKERASCSFDEGKVQPELSSPEKFSSDCGDRGDGYASFNNNDYFTCKQDLSVDDYNTPTDEPVIDAFPQVEMHRFEGVVSLAPSSSCTFRSIPYTTSRGDEYSVPFPLPTTFNEFDNERSSATQELFYPSFHNNDSWIRRDQSLSEVTYQSSEHFSSSQEMLTTWY